ncbi:hypothetical protein HYC85_028805 [Camellia sinensis]|uniref:RBR-type E3 ubiquitin transferase n=1 Tax=Camellia sinensis TaxID=4442 RepID=A0A7J7G064_CAMSI|nr:hypothetical protein HYC85_028805 [Camellia sinensis]
MAQLQSFSDLKTLVNAFDDDDGNSSIQVVDDLLISDFKTLYDPFVDDDDNSSIQQVDDFYFSALSNENEDQMFPISDSKYAEELQFQEALMSSVIASKSSVPPLMMIEEKAKAEEVGESSHGFCEICVEKKEADEMFRIDTCSHSFCSDCISKHVTMKIQDHITVVSCPTWDCSGVLQLDDCRPRMSRDVIERWDEVLCESMIPASEKFYCPFKDCSFMLVNDNGEEVIRECECPKCHRLFCAQCYVPWHSGIECEEFQRLNEDERGREDLMVRELAKSSSWMRCPHCKFYVEKTEGCLHMTCRCSSVLFICCCMVVIAGVDFNSAMHVEKLGVKLMVVVDHDW